MSFLLRTALYNLTNDKLNAYAALVTSGKKPTRKDDLVPFVEKNLKSKLKDLWDQLDELDKTAVSETLYSDDLTFDTTKFEAKYGRLPSGVDWSGGFRSSPPLLRVFLHPNIYNLSLPQDIAQSVKDFVPKPAPLQVQTTSDLPDLFVQEEKRYEWKTNKHTAPERIRTTVTNQIAMTKRDMERASQQDLQTVLRLVASGKVAVSDKTARVSAATAKEIAKVLSGGDFYEIVPKKVAWEQEIGPIRSFSWPLLLQTAKLAEVHGKKLALTKAGLNALNVPAHETLRLIWQRLIKTTAFDEFQRIDAIKGQGGRGRHSMTAVEDRRTAIATALSKLPVNEWINRDEFSRFMQASGIHFEVTHSAWGLYLLDSNYGNLGLDDGRRWPILQGRYILCFLFEYAASLGLIDVAYISPFDINSDYSDLWGTDDLAFLSRYDGLLYFRLNALGAYCLGITPEYSPGKMQTRAKVSVMPSLKITVLEETLSPATALLLDTYAEQEAPTVWRLASTKALSAVEAGHQITELKEFLQSCDEQPLPETVEAFIKKTDKGARALRNTGLALMVECESEEIADAISAHKCTKDLCLKAGSKNLVVRAAVEERFRKAVNILGYGMPKA